ncbi:MAG: LysE family translocator [Paracoccaceae bacterium]|nr:LysE family translocator [Paracoccaceae bacterium]
MSSNTWIAYAIACFILSVIPGPSVLLITGQALAKGLRAAFVCIAGEIIGGVCLMALSLLGVGTLLAASSTLFFIVKWAGVAYLAYLGARQLMTAHHEPPEAPSANISKNDGRSNFGAGFLTALFNPKSIIFYMAFLAQFVDPAGNPVFQYAVLVSTGAGIAAIVLTGYAIAASRIKNAFANQKARRTVGYASGTFYIGGSAVMALTR